MAGPSRTLVLVLTALAAYAGASPPAATPARRSRPVFPGLDITDAVALGMVVGPSTAELTVVEAFDFACPHCQRIQGPIDELVREYAGRVRVVYKNYVLPRHDSAAHLAACAAGKQGKFRAFAAGLWRERVSQPLTAEQLQQAVESGDRDALERLFPSGSGIDLDALADDIGLDIPAFDAERQGPWCRALLERDQREIDQLGVDALPTFFAGTRRDIATSKQDLRALIDAALAAPR